MLKRLKEVRNDKKGFTLVELIVVLVILAILAALLIPSLTGYIDKAKKKQIEAETRQVVMAAQTLVDEEYAVLPAGTSDVSYDNSVGATAAAGDGKVIPSEITTLAEVKGDITALTISGGKVTSVTYESGSRTCTFDGSKYTTTP